MWRKARESKRADNTPHNHKLDGRDISKSRRTSSEWSQHNIRTQLLLLFILPRYILHLVLWENLQCCTNNSTKFRGYGDFIWGCWYLALVSRPLRCAELWKPGERQCRHRSRLLGSFPSLLVCIRARLEKWLCFLSRGTNEYGFTHFHRASTLLSYFISWLFIYSPLYFFCCSISCFLEHLWKLLQTVVKRESWHSQVVPWVESVYP